MLWWDIQQVKTSERIYITGKGKKVVTRTNGKTTTKYFVKNKKNRWEKSTKAKYELAKKKK